MVVRGAEGPGQAIDQPPLAVVVVHGERAIWLEVGARLLHRLPREEVALEPKGGLAADERQGVGEREQDQVVLLVGPLEERPPIVDVDADARVVVGVLGVTLGADLLEAGVDLDRVHVPGALGQCDRHVRPRPGADDQDVLEGCRRALVGQEVDRLALAARIDRGHRLVRDAVDVDVGDVRCVHGSGRLDLVIGRPRPRRLDRLPANDQEQPGKRDELHRTPVRQQDEKERSGHEAPDDRRRPQEGDDREADDPEDAPGDVEPVRLERLELHELAPDTLGDHRHQPGDGNEDDREHQPRRQSGCLRRAEVDEVLAAAVDLHREEQDEGGEERERDGRVREEVDPRVRAQEADADAEEAPEKNEVAEVRQVDDVRAGPANERQLHEEHQEAEQDEAQEAHR